MNVLQLRAAPIAGDADLVPAVAVTRLATMECISPAADWMLAAFVVISVHSLPGHGHGSLGAATEARGRVVVAAALGQQCQGQECLVMHGVEVHRFVESNPRPAGGRRPPGRSCPSDNRPVAEKPLSRRCRSQAAMASSNRPWLASSAAWSSSGWLVDWRPKGLHASPRSSISAAIAVA